MSVYPDPDPESATVDGAVALVWADVSGYYPSDDASAVMELAHCESNDYTCFGQWSTSDSRLIALFDTSPLPDNSIITSARLSIFTSSPASTGGSLDIRSSNPSSNTALPTWAGPSDYDSFGGVSFGSLPYSSLANGGYTMISLNSNGIGYISRTGITKLGVMDTGLDSVIVSTADSPGTSQDPKLTVTYTVP